MDFAPEGWSLPETSPAHPSITAEQFQLLNSSIHASDEALVNRPGDFSYTSSPSNSFPFELRDRRNEAIRALLASIETDLMRLKWPWCRSRPNVTPAGQDVVQAFPLGLVVDRATGPMISRFTRLHPEFTAKLNKLMKLVRPSFHFTTIQLNCNYDSALHVDANNAGPSAIVGLGDYEGGELWQFDPDQGTIPMVVPNVMRGWASRARPGEEILVISRNIHHQFCFFDGCCPHMTLPSKGTRFSIVYFVSNRWERLSSSLVQELRDLRFKVPDSGWSSTAALVEMAKHSRLESFVHEVCVPHAESLLETEDHGNETGAELTTDEFDNGSINTPVPPADKQHEFQSVSHDLDIDEDMNMDGDYADADFQADMNKIDDSSVSIDGLPVSVDVKKDAGCPASASIDVNTADELRTSTSTTGLHDQRDDFAVHKNQVFHAEQNKAGLCRDVGDDHDDDGYHSCQEIENRYNQNAAIARNDYCHDVSNTDSTYHDSADHTSSSMCPPNSQFNVASREPERSLAGDQNVRPSNGVGLRRGMDYSEQSCFSRTHAESAPQIRPSYEEVLVQPGTHKYVEGFCSETRASASGSAEFPTSSESSLQTEGAARRSEVHWAPDGALEERVSYSDPAVQPSARVAEGTRRQGQLRTDLLVGLHGMREQVGEDRCPRSFAESPGSQSNSEGRGQSPKTGQLQIRRSRYKSETTSQ